MGPAAARHLVQHVVVALADQLALVEAEGVAHRDVGAGVVDADQDVAHRVRERAGQLQQVRDRADVVVVGDTVTDDEVGGDLALAATTTREASPPCPVGRATAAR